MKISSWGGKDALHIKTSRTAPAYGGDPRADAEQECHGDASRPSINSQFTKPAPAIDWEARKGAGGTTEEAKQGEPPLIHAWAGVVVAQSRRLIQEWPQEGPAQAQADQCPYTYRVATDLVDSALVVVDFAAVSPVTILGVVTSMIEHLSGCK